MMSLKKGSLNAAQAETYYAEKYTVDDYYSQGQEVTGVWIGQAATQLGFVGNVTREDFSALLQGIHPRSGAVLVQKASGYDQHAAGWDGVFNAPKSVSIQALIGQDYRILQAHKIAVQRAITEVEKYAMARAHGGREFVVSANITGAAFTHIAARPVGNVDHGPDPHLHTHVVILNVTRRPDGQIRALSPVEIYRSQRIGSAIYRSELACELQQLGYEIDVLQGDGKWELRGYSRDQVMGFSSRRREIEDKMDQLGVSGPKAAQLVTLSTRNAKEQFDEAELKAEWRQRAAAYGIDVKRHLWEALGRPGHANSSPDELRTAVEFAKAHTINRDAVVDRRDLEAAALQRGMGRITLADVRAQMQREQGNASLIPTTYDVRHPQGAFTTDEMLKLERRNIALAKGPASPVATPEEIEAWGQSKRLSAEQINAVQVALNSQSWTSIIEGFAGATKTTTVGAVREFAEQHGYIVRGFGMTTTAVKAMRKAGIKAQTIASLLANPLPSPTGPELWFVDESSLVSTVTAHRIISAARELGINRFVFVGDQAQHQSIEAGAPVRQLLAEGIPMATLQDIRRQQDPQLRQAVRTAHDDGRAAFDLLHEQGRITEIADVNQRYRQIAADYVGGHEAGQNTLVVSPGNDERKALNAEIRSLLVKRGYVQKDGREHQILVRRDLTPAQIAHAGSYREGDVIYCTGNRAQQRQGIKKNSYLTVDSVDRRGQSLVLQSDTGHVIEASPARWESAVEVYSPEIRTISVGDRLQFRHPDHKRDVANAEFAVIKDIGKGQVTLKLQDKAQREIALPYSGLRHVDYGYAVTSFSSQGSTVDRVIVNDDSLRSSKLVNREQEYVSISRAKLDARIYTDDAQALRQAVSRDPKKEIAVEAVKQRATQIQPHRSPTTGIRI